MDRDATISAIYAAAAGRGDWQSALLTISEALGLWCFQILAVDKTRRALVFAEDCGQVGPKVALDYFRYYHAVNPRVPPSMTMRCGEWFHDHLHFDDHFVARSEFYQEYLIPSGGRYLSGTKLIDTESLVVLFGAMRGVGGDPLGTEELRLLESLRVHFIEASRIFIDARSASIELAAARSIIEPIPNPVFVLDDRLEVRHQNSSARDFLARSDCLQDDNGRLTCKSVRDANALRIAFNRIDEVGAEKPPWDRAAFKLHRKTGEEVYGCLTRLNADVGIDVFGASYALMMLYDPSSASGLIDDLMLSEMFGLTPAEVQVAVAVAMGTSPECIAERKGVSISTVRSHLQRIFDKTGVCRQLELTKLILSLPYKPAQAR